MANGQSVLLREEERNLKRKGKTEIAYNTHHVVFPEKQEQFWKSLVSQHRFLILNKSTSQIHKVRDVV